MPDLRTLMTEAVADLDAPGAAPEQDLSRARRALVRQRTRQAMIPAGLAAAAAGVLTFSVLANGPQDASTQATPTGTSAPAGAASIGLISYSGDQPEGFTIDQVPDGWTVQESNESYLLIAPKGAKNQDPSSFEDKILISLASQEEATVKRSQVHPLEVDGVQARRFTWDTEQNEAGEPVPGPDAPAGLLKPEGRGWLVFQFADGLTWDDATIAEFAAGVHATGDAVPGNG